MHLLFIAKWGLHFKPMDSKNATASSKLCEPRYNKQLIKNFNANLKLIFPLKFFEALNFRYFTYSQK